MSVINKLLIGASVALLLTAHAHAEFDGGGVVGERMREVDNLNKVSHGQFRLPHVCMSACTMYLTVKGACMEDRAVLGFHGASSDGGNTVDPTGTQIAESYLPARIAAWAEEHHAFDTTTITIMSAETAWSLGVARCGSVTALKGTPNL